jgi:hypothetical protein
MVLPELRQNAELWPNGGELIANAVKPARDLSFLAKDCKKNLICA